ncbi:MAG: hypothetical protein ABIK42_03145 [candidate division WOR-3 bacterium]
MHKRIFLIFAVALVATTIFALEPGETEFEHNGWYRYTNQSSGLKLTQPSVSRFALERGYIRLSHRWSPPFFTKMTVDIFSSDKYPEGATVRLKEAYADLALPLIKDLNLTAGLQKHYFGLIYSWDYTHPEKSLADDQSVCASADYGVTINGFLPSGLGELQLGVYNGEGYKYAGKYVNTSPELLGNLRLTPLAGITIGASVFTNARDESPYKNDKKGRTTVGTDIYYMNADTSNKNRLGFAPMAKLAYGPISVTLEYIGYNYTRWFSYYKINRDSAGQIIDSTLVEKTKKYQMAGLDVLPIVTIPGRKVEIFGRFSIWNRKEEHGDAMELNKDKSFIRYGGGFNYHFIRREKGKPGLEFQFAWIRTQPKNSDIKPTDVLLAQVRFEWSTIVAKPQL